MYKAVFLDILSELFLSDFSIAFFFIVAGKANIF